MFLFFFFFCFDLANILCHIPVGILFHLPVLTRPGIMGGGGGGGVITGESITFLLIAKLG